MKITKRTYRRAKRVQSLCMFLYLILMMSLEDVTVWHFVAAVIIAIPLFTTLAITNSYEDDMDIKGEW